MTDYAFFTALDSDSCIPETVQINTTSLKTAHRSCQMNKRAPPPLGGSTLLYAALRCSTLLYAALLGSCTSLAALSP